MKISNKHIVLFALFIVPLLFYIFLSLGINNFAKLPVLTKKVIDVSAISKKHQFDRKISIVTFLGNDIDVAKGELFNLNEKIYKPFYDFKDFQLIVIAPKGTEEEVEKLQKKLGEFTNMVRWNFIFASETEIKVLFDSFKTGGSLDKNLHSSKAFIIDKDTNLRGRDDDKDAFEGKMYGYLMTSVAELKNKMKDDVKVVLAEYRLALKKNNADRQI
ncbi:hypothetical protein H3Z83_06365 [Tenacibaculum sp. S7007]|uniref:Membrane or secreted protein n=1 Tax=Tenacibaculum pelagium TaxID=2759527 RepID=A0A839APQ0_9FLAO|nr:hypothetical protein [Tenacibaculum pelagium]MBA6156144.1 hypothetical protein [Tenacibaculum pelagium]